MPVTSLYLASELLDGRRIGNLVLALAVITGYTQVIQIR
jgi:hypothetical protein